MGKTKEFKHTSRYYNLIKHHRKVVKYAKYQNIIIPTDISRNVFNQEPITSASNVESISGCHKNHPETVSSVESIAEGKNFTF